MSDPTPVSPPADRNAPPDVATRAWQHALHEETVFNDTGNFFLVAQAMLLVFYATLGDGVRPWALLAIAVLGLIVTMMWLVINVRQENDLHVAVERLEECCPDYAEFKSRRSGRSFRSARPILSKGVPLVVGLTWAVLIVEVITSGL